MPASAPLHAGQAHGAHHLGGVAVDVGQRGRVDPDRVAPRMARLHREATFSATDTT